MEQTQKRFGSLWPAAVIVAVLLAVLIAVETPLVAFAEDAGKGKYIKETVMITASNQAEALQKVQKLNDQEKKAAEDIKKANASKPEKDRVPVPVPKTYYLCETPIYSHGATVDATEGITQTYIAYTTTNNVHNSVKAIKTMYMKGGWSYDEYENYLQQKEDEADFLAKDLYFAICEYARHLNEGQENAVYAKKILEYIKEDDSGKNLSDFFVTLASYSNYNLDCVKKPLSTFVLQSNVSILATVESALMIACKDSYQGYTEDEDDVNFLTGMQRRSFLKSVNGYRGNTEYAYLDVYAQDLLVSLPDVQEDIRFYMNSGHMVTPEVEEATLALQEIELDLQDEVYDGEIETPEEYEEAKKEAKEELESEYSEEELAASKKAEDDQAYFDTLSAENLQHYNNGKLFYHALENCKYTGYEDSKKQSQYQNLLGLFMAHENMNEYSNDDFYPLLIQLSKGQRALLKVGLTQFLSSTLLSADILEDTYETMLGTLNETAETEDEKIKKGQTVSVYQGIDRSLFQKNSGIALTSAALKATKSVPLDHVVSNSEIAQKVCTITAIAAGATSAIAMITAIGKTIPIFRGQSALIGAFNANLERIGTLPYGFADVFTKFKDVGSYRIWTTITPEAGGAMGGAETTYAVKLELEGVVYYTAQGQTQVANASFMRTLFAFLKSPGFGLALNVINALAIAAMIISIIINYVYPLIHAEDNEPYIDIPRVMCSYEEVYGQTVEKDKDPIKGYIYYYGMKNPFLTEEDNKRANVREGGDGKDTDIMKYGIGDVAHWTLKGKSRQWVAIYTTTDSRAGEPILAESLTVSEKLDVFDDENLIPVKGFHENSPFNFNQAYAATVNQNLTPVYLGYRFDTDLNTETASVFSSFSLWGGVIAGFICGGGIGTLVTYGIVRKRKKKMA